MYGPKSGGLRTTMNELSMQYAKSGHTVLLVVPGEKDSYENSGAISRITVAAPKIPFSGGYRIIVKPKKVIGRLQDFRPDILEISDRTTLLKVARWARSRGIPTTFFAHERVDGIVRSFAQHFPLQKVLVRQWNRKTRDSVGRIVATTKFAAQEFEQLGLTIDSAPRSKLVSVPLGVDLERFDPRIRDLENRSFAHFPPNYIFACTRLSKEKDPLFLLEIAQELKTRGIDTPLVIAGTGPLESNMKQVIERDGLNVLLLGFVSDRNNLSYLMSAATLFLAVGPIETFGLAALEALACGTPVICRAEAAISEIIDEKSGRALFRSSTEWADAIIELSGLDREETRRNARARAEKFTWKETADQLLRFYRWDVAS
jgi:alpha-1,6-mannosyltransferase